MWMLSMQHLSLTFTGVAVGTSEWLHRLVPAVSRTWTGSSWFLAWDTLWGFRSRATSSGRPSRGDLQPILVCAHEDGIREEVNVKKISLYEIEFVNGGQDVAHTVLYDMRHALSKPLTVPVLSGQALFIYKKIWMSPRFFVNLNSKLTTVFNYFHCSYIFFQLIFVLPIINYHKFF